MKAKGRKPSKGSHSTFLWTNGLFLLLSGLTSGLDVHFDDPSAGFFIRERSSSASGSNSGSFSVGNLDNEVFPTTSIVLGGSDSSEVKKGQRGDEKQLGKDTIRSESFTVLRRAQPISIKAQYGPFRVSQTVPTQYIVPDLSEIGGKISRNKKVKESKSPGLITDFKPHQLDLSAHLVTKQVTKDHPVLRVLFHTGSIQSYAQSKAHASSTPLSDGGTPTLCIVLHAHSSNGTKVTAHCTPDERDGTCLGEAVIPSAWWPSMTNMVAGSPTKMTSKQPKVEVKVTYAVYETESRQCSGFAGGENKASRLATVVPETPLAASVPLTFHLEGYRQVGHDDFLHMLIPQSPIFPGSRVFVPLMLYNNAAAANEDGPVKTVTIKLRSRSGIRLVGVQSISKSWTVSAETNPRGTTATVVITRNEDADHESNEKSPTEIFDWLFQVEGRTFDAWNKVKLAWQITYTRDNDNSNGAVNPNLFDDASAISSGENETSSSSSSDESGVLNHSLSLDHYKIRARIEVHKDDVQAILPITKSELINLAVLTGRQVSRPLKIFMVSRAGQIADVTLHSSCSSKDDSVLKVSSSCTSVYVDGSETRGALSAKIDVKYGSLAGEVALTIWMAEMPLKIEMDDSRLSQVKGWKVGRNFGGKRSARNAEMESSHHEVKKRDISSNSKADSSSFASFLSTTKITPKDVCQTRFQQSQIRVFARFTAEDPDSGRKDYFPSRNLDLDVTDLIAKGRGIRVEDAGVATLRGVTLEGRTPGRTEVQVVSPITGQVIGRKEVRVTKNKETITGMKVRVISGLRLNIMTSASQQKDLFTVRTTYSDLLSSQYQEGLLDIELSFSDDTKANLRDVNPNDFYLNVKSLNREVIAFAPSQNSRHPRVVAVGSGSGELLRVFLEIQDECMTKSMVPLAMSKANVNIRLTGKKNQGFTPAVDIGNLNNLLMSNIALRDDQNYFKPSVNSAARQHPNHATYHPRGYAQHLTPLEIGMFVLLAVFCAAIAIFVASCFVYASKYKGAEYPLNRKSQSIQNAHDWVWLGKSTIEKASSIQTTSIGSSRNTLDDLCSSPEKGEVRLRSKSRDGCQDNRKSQRLSYVGSEINIIPNPRTDEYEAEVSHPNSPEEQPQDHVGQHQPRQPRSNLMMMNAPLSSSRHIGNELYPELPRRGSGSSGAPHHSGARRKQLPASPVPPSSHRRSTTRLPPGHPGHHRMLPSPNPPRTQQSHPSGYLNPTHHMQQQQQQVQRQGYPSGQTRAPPEYRPIPNNLGAKQRPRYRENEPVSRFTQYDRRQQQIIREEVKRRSAERDQSFDSATYTKRETSSPPGDILPVGYPLFPATNMEAGDHEIPTEHEVDNSSLYRRPEQRSGSRNEELLSQQEVHPASLLSPLDLPDPTTALMNPTLRQSPASALPPLSGPDDFITKSPMDTLPRGAKKIAEETIEEEVNVEDEGEDEDFPLNPDLDRPSPPRTGAPRLFENPFDLTDEETNPIKPEEKLSPSHIFESDLENFGSYSRRSSTQSTPAGSLKRGLRLNSPPIDSSTFVRSKSLSPTVIQEESEMEALISSPEEEVKPEVGEPEVDAANADAEAVDMEMDYEQLMSYFESLKESSA